MTRPIAWILGGTLLGSMLLGVVVFALFAAVLTGGSEPGGTSAAPQGCSTAVEAGGRSVGLDDEQLSNARTIVSTGKALGVPPRGLVIAVATAMQESTLRNLDYGDRDSLGLFQQRPSQGWGTPTEVRDPGYAATRFFRSLLQVPEWGRLPLTVAAQRVQRSAFPNAYAKWDSLATALVGYFDGSTASDGAGCPATVAAPLPETVAGDMLRSALAQQGEPYVFGATGPDAFDCSGLLVYAWRKAGYRLTLRTAEQMFRASTPVPPGQEQPGDLVFSEFGTRVPGAGHVAIVLERGLVVEAPSAGKTVRIRPYDPHASGQRIGRLPSSVLVPLASMASMS